MVTPDGEAITCARHRLLRRLLGSLVDAHAAQTGEPVRTAALIAAGWPDERILPAAARNRIHVAVYRLRRLGLERWLEQYDDGWRLSPQLVVEVSGLSEPVRAHAASTRSQ